MPEQYIAPYIPTPPPQPKQDAKRVYIGYKGGWDVVFTSAVTAEIIANQVKSDAAVDIYDHKGKRWLYAPGYVSQLTVRDTNTSDRSTNDWHKA